MDANISDFLHALRPRVAGDLRADAYTRTLYSTDASLYQVMPHAVLIPRHADDMQAAIELAARDAVPVLPRAGGSSLAGQTVNAALVMDTARWLDQVLEVNAEERWVRVQPGLVLDTLNARLKAHGLQFGPDPASSNRAGLGGIVSNNATGSHSIVYGMAVDHVLEMKVLLDDGAPAHFRPLSAAELHQHQQKAGREGEIYRRVAALVDDEQHRDSIRAGTPKHWRRCGGYNLARFLHDGSIDHYLPQDSRFNLVNLLAGAEGTLAAITELKLKLVPRPKRTVLAIVEFPTLLAALEATPAILETSPTAVELIDDLSLRMAAANRDAARLVKSFVKGSPFCFLVVEYQGDTEAELRAQVQTLLSQSPNLPISPLYDPKLQANVWAVRKIGLGLLMSMRSEWKPIPFIEDTAVPPQHLAEYIPRIDAFCRELGTTMTYYAHASSGCLHIRPLLNLKQGADIDKMRAISLFVADLLGDYGGALSSEHGDGRVRSWLAERFYGPALYGLFREVKAAFDPHNLFNPGNIVDAPAQDRDLRYGPEYQAIPLQSALHWPSGFAAEVEMCNGAGVCRKLTTGAMCPSFMATREEEHSTRGRANLLRAALSGRLPATELTSPRLYAALELCVACKACKSECPSSVDMARLKTEFLAHYYAVHPRRKRDYLFAHIDTLSRLASGWRAPLANWALGLDVTKSILDRWFGISKDRSLPRFSREPFVRANLQSPISQSPNLLTSPPLLAALLTAFYAYFVLYGAMTQTEGLFLLAVLWSLERALAVKGRLEIGDWRLGDWGVWGAVVTLGVSVAVATLLRQSILPWVAVMLVWLLAADGVAQRRVRGRTLAALAVVVAILLAAVLPFTLRNYRAYGELLLLNSNTGYAMYSAQHPLHGVSFDAYAAAPLPDDLTPPPTNEAQWDRALMARGVQFVLDDPGRYLLLSASRVVDYFEFWPKESSSLIFNVGRMASFTLLLPFMVYGVWVVGRGTRDKGRGARLFSPPAFLLLFVLVYSLLHIFTWAMPRYRLPVDAVLLIFAAAGLSDLVRRTPWIKRRWNADQTG